MLLSSSLNWIQLTIASIFQTTRVRFVFDDEALVSLLQFSNNYLFLRICVSLADGVTFEAQTF